MRRLTSVLFILFSLIAAGCILIFSLRIHEEIKAPESTPIFAGLP